MGRYVRDTLVSGEVLIYEAKTTLWSYSSPLLLASLCTLGAFYLIAGFAKLILICLAFFLCLSIVMRLLTTELSVTSKRVVSKVGFISRHLVEVHLDRFESIRISQSLGGRLLNYGSLVISGSGNPTVPLPSIADPLEFRRIVVEAQDEARAGKGITCYDSGGGRSSVFSIAVPIVVAAGLGLTLQHLGDHRYKDSPAASIVNGNESASTFGQPSEVKPSSKKVSAYGDALASHVEEEQADYLNEKFGYSIRYPKDMGASGESTDENGQIFQSSDGAVRLSVTGANTSGETVTDMYEGVIHSTKGEIGYHACSKSWFVVTSNYEGVLRYQKTFAGDGSSNTFIFEFPEEKKAELDSVLVSIEKSFRHGDLSRAW